MPRCLNDPPHLVARLDCRGRRVCRRSSACSSRLGAPEPMLFPWRSRLCGLVGIFLAYLRRVPSNLWAWFKRRIMIEIDIPDRDEVFNWTVSTNRFFRLDKCASLVLSSCSILVLRTIVCSRKYLRTHTKRF